MHIRGRIVTDRNTTHEKRIRVGRRNYSWIAGDLRGGGLVFCMTEIYVHFILYYAVECTFYIALLGAHV